MSWSIKRHIFSALYWLGFAYYVRLSIGNKLTRPLNVRYPIPSVRRIRWLLDTGGHSPEPNGDSRVASAPMRSRFWRVY